MNKYLFTVGTYAEADTDSIFWYQADFAQGKFTRQAAYRGVSCPSYLLQGKNGLLYAVEELAPDGNIAVYIRSADGIQKRRELPSNGAHPCHLAIDEKERFLFAANYTSGSLAMFEIDAEGLPRALCFLKQHAGKGMNLKRQEGAHVHFSKAKEGLLYVCDLGLDTVFCYRINAEKKALEETDRNLRLPDGNGPRHLCFHPKRGGWLFVFAELTARIFVFHQKDGVFALKQEILSLPAERTAVNLGAAIKPSEDGKYFFVSNRGDDSVTAFLVTEEGLLTSLHTCATGGKAPRDIEVFGDYIIIANQDSSSLTALRFNRAQGRLEQTRMRETVPLPSCIARAEWDPCFLRR
ncbi:MAG: lactonase family protein [Peptococcaceae bacterium]|nr:lactonase family protein [Peptococcaceae bacterium]